jgi:hypothetical protein
MPARTSQPSHPVDSPLDLGNVLQGIAMLGMVTAEQVQRLWLPEVSIWTVRRFLKHRRDDGLIVRHRPYTRPPRGAVNCPPQPQGHWWTLTKKGLDLGSNLLGTELRTVGLRSALLVGHDGMVVDTCVRLIELARGAGVSGVYVQREARLEYQTPAQQIAWLNMDAVIYVRTAPDAPVLPGVPWTTHGPLPHERTHRFAIEADNGTEGDSVIAAKARAYQAAERTAKLDTLPTVVWVVRDRARRQRIHGLWEQTWPQGTWLLATTDEVAQGTWWRYANGPLQAVQLFA